jgi:sulfur-carrier protein adenylyltransferase/sulfurtransferase
MKAPRTHHGLALLKRKQIHVALVGCGGNGSRLAVELKNIALSWLAWSGNTLNVVLFDPDVVSEANMTRQSFYPCDRGRNKAQILVERINRSYGLNWRAIAAKPSKFDLQNADIVITCVDSARARGDVLAAMSNNREHYHIDLGNEDTFGQVLIGTRHARGHQRMLSPSELHPELFDLKAPTDDRPSCGTIEALRRQDLSVNLMVVCAAHNLLWRLLKDQTLRHRGYVVNLEAGVVPLPILPIPRSKREPKNDQGFEGRGQ